MLSTNPSRLEDDFSVHGNWIPDPNALQRLVVKHAEEYRTNLPFPHVVMDDFLPSSVAAKMLQAFPGTEEGFWFRTDIPQEKKLAVYEELVFPEVIRQLLYVMNGATMLSFLEKLSGIEGLIPDPYFEGGGIHQIVRGGKLGVHVDFNRHAKLKLDRRLNFLLYLNRDWKDEYGGHLELWNGKRSTCEKKVLPIFNRAVVFSTTERSFHGHPHPLTCPEGVTRKSLALYYYTNGTTAASRAFVHGTNFLDTEAGHASLSWKQRTRKWARELTPPLFYRLAKAALARIGIRT